MLIRKTKEIKCLRMFCNLHSTGNFSLVSNGDTTSIDFSVVSHFCWASPTRGVFDWLKSLIVNQLTDFIIVLLCCSSGFGVQCPLDFSAAIPSMVCCSGSSSGRFVCLIVPGSISLSSQCDVWQHDICGSASSSSRVASFIVSRVVR